MFPQWRLKLRAAQLALQGGRLEEAATLLTTDSLREYLPAKKLAQDTARRMVERAGTRFEHGDSGAGWRDLAIAERLGGQAEAIGSLRDELTAAGLAEIGRYLGAGQPAAAQMQLARLQRKGLLGEVGRMLEQIASAMHDAQIAARHGHFAEAAAILERACKLAAKSVPAEDIMEIVQQLESQAQDLAARQLEGQRLTAELHAGLKDQDWSAVLTSAEAMLAVAPFHEAARQARRQAWKAVGMDVTSAFDRGRPARHVSLDWNRAAVPAARRSTRHRTGASEIDTVSGVEVPKRVLLWVDAVGGFLLCLDDQVVLGQPSPGNPIAVPILADLSRRHAVIRREAGAYVLEPIQPVKVDGRTITGPTVLADRQRIQLGDSVRLRFTRPHALSATARLDFESHHKSQPTADAVLLMADSCVLGNSEHAHVRLRDSQHDVVFYRNGEGFQCRSAGQLQIDGETRQGPVDVPTGGRVEGDCFSFSWEIAG